ncbi:hypothetical protein BC941DRAFT_477031 [Chlamydoabsidia padenii]|nr:hypothetical protein BC941DRAFT_477031 [Chlamydoabsidia padenii]
MNNNNKARLELLITAMAYQKEKSRRIKRRLLERMQQKQGCRFILETSPLFVIRRPRQNRPRQNGFWELNHPNLTDDGNEGDAFKRHYRVGLATFTWLVNSLEVNPVFAQDNPRSIPIHIQVATVLWRFGNTHVPFRLAEVLLGISTGSYRNFTERFFTALNERHKHQIHWPTTQEELNATMGGFACIEESEFETSLWLPNVIGALDGKLVRIHKPSDEPGTVVAMTPGPSTDPR